MNWALIPALVIAAVALAGYLNERRKTRLAEGVERRDATKFRRDEDQEFGDVLNRRVELLLVNLSTERDRLSAKVDQLETLIGTLRDEVANLREALRVATRGR